MSKIYIKKSSTMMGRSSDTRMYTPRSESSHMYRANNEDESTYTGVEDPRYRDELADKKKKQRKDEEEDERFNPREGDREPSLQTGTSGNFGALTSLAMQARGPGFAGGEGVEGYKYSSEPMESAWSEILKSKKSKKKEKKAKKEERKKWRPSTGMFRKPPGGFDISTANPRRAKARMRGIKGGKRTGLGRAHLSVEMGHRTVGRNKQPTSKDIGRYRQYLGQQEAQRRLGNIRSPTSIPARFGARSFRAGSTGGGALRQLPGQAALARRPAIRRPTRPRMIPARGVRRPTMPRAPRMPATPSPQYQSGYARQSMAGGAQYAPSRMPSASVQGGPSMVMTSEVGDGSDLQKRGMTYYDTAELRQLINEARRALKQKESKKKGMGTRDTGGAGSSLPRHNNAPTKETTRPEGATEDANNDPRTFGVNPLDHLTGKGGRTP
jgi:hypothetical protein